MCNVERCADDIDDCCLVRSRVNGGYIANSSVGCYPGTCSISSSRDVAKKLVNGSILQLRYRFPSRFKTHIQHLSFSVAMKPIKDDGFTNAHALHIKGCSRSKQAIWNNICSPQDGLQSFSVSNSRFPSHIATCACFCKCDI